MSKVLQTLLGANEPLFAQAMRRLEASTGKSGVDVRLIADILERAHAVMRQLGLDPAATTAQELYHALEASVAQKELFASTEFVGLELDSEIISFNHQDIEANASRSFGDRQTDLMRVALEKEIVHRYSDHPATDEQLVRQFASDAGIVHADPEVKRLTVNEPLHLLAIGDIFSDAFIKLPEGSARVIEQDGRKWLALPFGDKPPYEQADIVRSVGPSPNAAVSAARLGLSVGLMAWIGDDQVGEEALDYLKEQSVGTELMIREDGKLTSYWYVLRYGADRTMLVKSEKYRYEWRDPAREPEWIYLAYIGEDSWPLHEGLIQYLETHPNVKFALQPGTFHFQWGAEKLAKLYARSHIVVMNREEAADVTNRAHESVRDLAEGLHELGPEIVVITDGANGSYAFYDNRLVTIPNYPDPAPPLDRTGAGDAFASTIVSGLALGKTMDEVLTWAPINSMNVVQHLGAQAGLLDRETIQKHLESAPDNYKITEVTE